LGLPAMRGQDEGVGPPGVAGGPKRGPREM